MYARGDYKVVNEGRFSYRPLLIHTIFGYVLVILAYRDKDNVWKGYSGSERIFIGVILGLLLFFSSFIIATILRLIYLTLTCNEYITPQLLIDKAFESERVDSFSLTSSISVTFIIAFSLIKLIYGYSMRTMVTHSLNGLLSLLSTRFVLTLSLSTPIIVALGLMAASPISKAISSILNWNLYYNVIDLWHDRAILISFIFLF